MSSWWLSSPVRRVLAVAGLSFREAWRRRVVIAALIMTVGFLGLFGVGLHYLGEGWDASFAQMGVQGRIMKTMMSSQVLLWVGLLPSSMIVGFIAVFASAGSVASELDTGVLSAVLTRPIRRGELIIGKFLGVGSMLSVFAGALFASVIGLAVWQVGTPTRNMLVALPLFMLEPIILLSLGMLGSIRWPALAAGVLCVAAYGIAFMGGLIEQFGSILSNTTMMDIGIVSSLFVPIDAVHRKAVAILLPNAFTAAPGGAVGPPVTAAVVPSTWMIVYAIVFPLVVVWFATRVFRRRPL